MYHDEFEAKTIGSGRRSYGDDALPPGALEIGGGLSMGLAASLAQPIPTLLFAIGGLLPLLTCCASIIAHRCGEFLAGLSRALPAATPRALPIPTCSPRRGPSGPRGAITWSARAGVGAVTPRRLPPTH